MDFDLLDLREAATKEYWVHLRKGDTLLYADMEKQEGACRIKVASSADPDVEDSYKAVQRLGKAVSAAELDLAMAPNREKRRPAEQRLDALEKDAERTVRTYLENTVKGWENITKGGKPLEFSKTALSDMAQPKAPLFVLAVTIAEDAQKAQDPFSDAEVA